MTIVATPADDIAAVAELAVLEPTASKLAAPAAPNTAWAVDAPAPVKAPAPADDIGAAATLAAAPVTVDDPPEESSLPVEALSVTEKSSQRIAPAPFAHSPHLVFAEPTELLVVILVVPFCFSRMLFDASISKTTTSPLAHVTEAVARDVYVPPETL